METLRLYYDDLYSSGERDPQDDALPAPEVLRLKEYLPAGSIIDLGAGEGRNSLALARQGFRVTALDLSPVGIQRLEDAAHAEGLTITTEVADLTRDELRGTYDACIAVLLMNHFSREEAERLIADVQAHTRRGGLNVITIFTDRAPLAHIEWEKFYPTPQEFRAMYEGWEIVEWSEATVEQETPQKIGAIFRKTKE